MIGGRPRRVRGPGLERQRLLSQSLAPLRRLANMRCQKKCVATLYADLTLSKPFQDCGPYGVCFFPSKKTGQNQEHSEAGKIWVSIKKHSFCSELFHTFTGSSAFCARRWRTPSRSHLARAFASTTRKSDDCDGKFGFSKGAHYGTFATNS